MGPPKTDQHRIYTVSELTSEIKDILEKTYPFIWIYGEISNFNIPSSGHFYFTLKDEQAQINAVMFRNQNRNLKFKPENGINISGLGRISVYEPRGTYQIIFEYLEPKGTGAIQRAFEQLKKRLADEGLFDEKHKKPLPFLPEKISIITSPTGAVVHDILKIIDRRFSNIHLEIVPVKVQGYGAESEIKTAIEMINSRFESDLIILARGGGSLEDFHAFNSEDVARAVFGSKIPIISAVGHETDFSITDFVADFRAPTPSVGAELAVPYKKELSRKITDLSDTLTTNFLRYFEHLKTILKGTSNRLVHPSRKVVDLRLRTDDMLNRLNRAFKNSFQKKQERLLWRTERLFSKNPLIQIKLLKNKLYTMNYNINIFKYILLSNNRSTLRELEARLCSLNPEAILARGYSITRTIPDAAVVRDPQEVSIGQDLEILVAGGAFICSVKRK
ncbi:MAG: exodeoxyribonuclease VII large subunit [Deltaproteobacteria bacterium]|jgi:exodeoxyribonuclease VII large subunit|nr:exodeoxyribonuclease VII large subunit [Deltaproteobacteria bacterium]